MANCSKSLRVSKFIPNTSVTVNHRHFFTLPLTTTTTTTTTTLTTKSKLPLPFRYRSVPYATTNTRTIVAAPASNSSKFTWDDVVAIENRSDCDNSSDLSGFLDKISFCNRNSEKKSGFIPFVVEERVVVGYVHHGFVEHLRAFKDVFVLPPSNESSEGDSFVSLHESLDSPEVRTRVVDEVIKSLGEQVIPGIRNELYPVSSTFGSPVYFSLERAAAPYFGIKAYGVHLNGFVERDDEKFLWVGKRNETKPTYPGMLDHLVAGGLPHGVSCKENLMKECEEEAGIPHSLSQKAIPVGAVSYADINGFRYKRDILFCYDLKLPDGFVPYNQDGEVESFKLMPVTNVAHVIRKTHFFKANCNLVIIDFLFRHGYISPDSPGYMELLQCLKREFS